jgi:CRISPR type IV-associated protein Csf3
MDKRSAFAMRGELVKYEHRYRHLTHVEPLRIKLHLKPGSQLAGYDPLWLDDLLAWCVIMEATHGHGVPDHTKPYKLVTPLQCLWQSADGLPLWAATPFMPCGVNGRDVTYWHKRAQSGEWTGTKTGNFSIRATQGRWMERRVPLPTVVAEWWEATCIGDAEEIGRLLGQVSHVGKRRSMGMGEVDHWVVEPGRFVLHEGGRLTRAMPAEAFDASDICGGLRPAGEPAPIGWTPPQWKPSLFRPGWWMGAELA